MKARIKCIDYLKTFAIIFVFFYHLGILKNGYLGVEIFLVISGYLFMKGIRKNIESDEFHPLQLIKKKISEFWPLLLISGILCFFIGFFTMLPDDFENLSESIVASNVFSNNILQAITAINYWDISNTYKPLMHTWYISVLLQSMIIYVVSIWIANKIGRKDMSKIIVSIITIMSLVLYMFTGFTYLDKFYLTPFRLFEMGAGMLIALIPNKSTSFFKALGYFAWIVIILICLGFISFSYSLLAVVCMTSIILYCHGNILENYGIPESLYPFLTICGKYSYDIYIWHQVVIAYLYYLVFQELNICLVILAVILTGLLSVSSVMMKKKKFLNNKLLICIVVCAISTLSSLYIYYRAGVVRDVPELGIQVDNVHRNMHAEYVDRPYSWDNEFTSSNKIKVLVIGNSFARDFANVLSESDLSNRIEISYVFGDNAIGKENRVLQADYVFYGTDSFIVPQWFLDNVDSNKLYIVGNKKFGNSNGIIYSHRFSQDYFNQTYTLPDDFIKSNNALEKQFGSHYIDMMTPVMKGNQVLLFTDDHYFISQDCRHLTKYGAIYYAKILNLSFFQR